MNILNKLSNLSLKYVVRKILENFIRYNNYSSNIFKESGDQLLVFFQISEKPDLSIFALCKEGCFDALSL